MLFVFFYHYNRDVFYFGWSGVDIFFAISGFVITLQCASLQRAHSPSGSIREFFTRRVSRIFPIYYALLLGLFLSVGIISAMGFTTLLEDVPDLTLVDTLWKNALFLTNFFIVADGYQSVAYGITWSLAVEEHFYLVFPFLYFWLPRQRLVATLCVLVALAICLRIYLANTMELPGRLYYLTFTRIDAILIGCIAAAVYINANKVRWLAAAWPIGVLSAGFLLYRYHHNEIFQIIVGYTVIPTAVALLILHIALHRPRWASRLLGLKSLRFIGSVSYGFYLIHIWIVNAVEAFGIGRFVLDNMGPYAGHVTLVTAELALITLLSYLSFRYFETPARRIVTRMLRPAAKLENA